MSAVDALKAIPFEDRRRAAERLLDDPLAMKLLDVIEDAAIQAMLDAPDDQGRREARDMVKTVRHLVAALRMQVTAAKEEARQPVERV